MQTELEDRLREKYPQLFRHLRTDPMASPLGRGIEIEDGWYDLLDFLCEEITGELVKHGDHTFTLEQVKQKFGLLRVYGSATDNGVIVELIATATENSRTICEPCGARGANLVTHKGRMQTLCPVCREKLQ